MDENFTWYPEQQNVLDEVFMANDDIVIVWAGVRSGKTLMSAYCAYCVMDKNAVYYVDLGKKRDIFERHVETFKIIDENLRVDNDLCSIFQDKCGFIKFISHKKMYEIVTEGSVVILHEPDYYLKSEDVSTFKKFIKDKKVKQVIIFGTVLSSHSFTTELIMSGSPLKLIKRSTFDMNPNITYDSVYSPYKPRFDEYDTAVTGND